MAYSDETLNRIFDRTDGHCHLCFKKLSFCNYRCYGARGAWEVEHSIPKSRGGTDHLNNLYAACSPCNREKAVLSTRMVRSWNGRSRAPYSRARKRQIRSSNTAKWAAVGFFVGSLAGPGGATLGAAIGASFGADLDPNG